MSRIALLCALSLLLQSACGVYSSPSRTPPATSGSPAPESPAPTPTPTPEGEPP